MANLSKDRIRHESLCEIRGRAYKIEVVKCLARKKEKKVVKDGSIVQYRLMNAPVVLPPKCVSYVRPLLDFFHI